MKLKLDNRVVLRKLRKDLKEASDAPLYGRKYGKILGTVTEVKRRKRYPISVRWDNGEYNDFWEDELQFIAHKGKKQNKKLNKNKVIKISKTNLMTMRGKATKVQMYLLGGTDGCIKKLIPLRRIGGCSSMPTIATGTVAKAITKLAEKNISSMGFGLARYKCYENYTADIKSNMKHWSYYFPNCILLLVTKTNSLCWRASLNNPDHLKRLELHIIRREVKKNGKGNNSKTGSPRPEHENVKRASRRNSRTTARKSKHKA